MNFNFFNKIKPARDWNILVIFFGLGLIVISIISWQIYLSNQIGGGYVTTESQASGVTVKAIDLKKLESALKTIENRKAAFDNLKEAKVKIVDPSL